MLCIEEEALRPLLEARIFAYDFLRRAFWVEPSLEYLRWITQEGYLEAFPFQTENDEIKKGIQSLKNYIRTHDVLQEREFDALHWDYTRMFIGPDKLLAPLWESAYVQENRLLFQEQTLKVRQAYLKYNVLPKQFKREADDHLGLELDFMYQLSVHALNAVSKGDLSRLTLLLDDQKTFLFEHLLKWVPDLSKAIIESANLDFYRAMANILKGFCTVDFEALKELLGINSMVP